MSGLESTAVFWLSQLLTAPFYFSPTLTYVDSPYGFPLFTPPAEKEQNDYLLPLLPPLPPPSPLRGATVLLSAAFHWAHVGVLGEGWDSGRASTERSKSILAFRKVNGKSGLTLERCFALFAKKDFSFQNILYMLSYLILLSVVVFVCSVEKRKNKRVFFI